MNTPGTFLFTDVEGSSRLWETEPAAMSIALARHDHLLHAAITAAHGRVFKTVGDAFCAIFPTADDAVAAALAIQSAISGELWPTTTPLRLRLALHRGEAEERSGDYFGPTINRLARLLDAGHGGQTLLSEAVALVLDTSLPPRAEVHDLGVHRLRDLQHSERILQLVVPGLPDHFPPLRTLDRRVDNLPAQPTPLIGRESELAHLDQLLRTGDTRLVTLTGPGGVGKTRLALQTAANLTDVFDRVYLISLAPITQPDLFLPTIAQTLGLRESPGRDLLTSLVDHLREHPHLLVLDNLEQLITAATDVADLLGRCPDLHLLATSRQALRLRAEHELVVPPLPLPKPVPTPRADLLASPAIRLFITRAHSIRPDLDLPTNAATIAEICRRLDGLPLAIELAAARVRHLPPVALLARLDRRLPFLTTGLRDLPARQQTLRTAIAWSYDLLTPEEQTLFHTLSIFTGGFTLDAADAVSRESGDGSREPDVFSSRLPTSDSRLSVLDGITSLVDQSLVSSSAGQDGEPRFTILETIREFGIECLEAAGELTGVRDRHAAAFLELAERASPEMTGPNQGDWLDRLDRDHDNLRAALRWLIDTAAAAPALRLTVSLYRFWLARGHLSEGRTWFERVLAVDAESPAALRARVNDHAGIFAHDQGDYARARAFHTEALRLYRAAEDPRGIADSLSNLATVSLYEGDNDAAAALFAESADRYRGLGDRRGLASSLNGQGLVALWQGDYPHATERYEESLALWRALDDPQNVARALSNLGDALLQQGDYLRAEQVCLDALSRFRALGNEGGAAIALSNLGFVTAALASPARAERFFSESISLARATGEAQIVVESLIGLAGCACDLSDFARGVRLFAAAETARAGIGYALPELHRLRLDRYLTQARLVLGEAAVATAWDEGRELSLDQAVPFDDSA